MRRKETKGVDSLTIGGNEKRKTATEMGEVGGENESEWI